jgi:hypothetical protein
VEQVHVMLEQDIKVFSLLDVDAVEDIFVNMDKNLIEVIDEDQLNVIINLDEVISLQNVHLMIPIDEINVRQNLKILIRKNSFVTDFTLCIIKKMQSGIIEYFNFLFLILFLNKIK